MQRLKPLDQLALGFMVFALFLGAGNIIFPPSAGMEAGSSVWWAASGFLITAVGLPLLGIVAVAYVGGGLSRLTLPLGKTTGLLIAVVVYLAIGPLFATPRTAMVSFEMAMVPITGNSAFSLALYCFVYFALVIFLAFHQGALVERIGKWITPILLLGLLVLGVSAVLFPSGSFSSPAPAYQKAPLLKGVVEGYLTMDTLGAVVFGVVVSSAIRNRGIKDDTLVMRYTIRAGLIAACGLACVYLAFFYLGATNSSIASDATNGAQILAAYVQHQFGFAGHLLLGSVIVLACLTTAVGLTVACGEFFSALLNVSYRHTVLGFAGFSLLVANIGLSQLISVSLPVLIALYPMAIMLVVLNLLKGCWYSAPRVFKPVMGVTFVFGVCDGLSAAGLNDWVPSIFSTLPLASQNLGWLLPVLLAWIVAVSFDQWSLRAQRTLSSSSDGS